MINDEQAPSKLSTTRQDVGQLSREPLEALVDYMYTGVLKLPRHSVAAMFGLLETARAIELRDVEQPLLYALTAIVGHETVIDIFQAAAARNEQRLVAKCLHFVDTHASEMLKSDRCLVRLTDTQLLMLVLRRDTFCEPETSVYELIKRWPHGDNSNRTLLVERCVRLDVMSKADLSTMLLDLGGKQSFASKELKRSLVQALQAITVRAGDERQVLSFDPGQGQGEQLVQSDYRAFVRESPDRRVLVAKLGNPTTFNLVKILAQRAGGQLSPESTNTSMAFTVETSLHGDKWKRVMWSAANGSEFYTPEPVMAKSVI